MTQDQEEDPRRLSQEELADLQREVDEPPLTEPVGPLPPLESDDPEWVAERWRVFALGQGPRRGRRANWSPTALRSVEVDSALVDVVCRGKHIARVYADPSHFMVTLEAQFRGPLLTHSPFALNDHPAVAVMCRCGTEHLMQTRLLAAEARRRTPGRPARLGVAHFL